MSDLIPWLALVVWLAAISLRVHPHTRSWAPRGIAGANATEASTPAPPLPVPRLPVDGDRRPRPHVRSVREVSS